jgi:VanZ family protein
MGNPQLSSWQSRPWRYAPLLFWVGVILFLSTQAGAMSETSRFVRPLLRWLFPLSPESTLEVYHGLIRKFAHFVEYAILAALTIRALTLSSVRVLRENRFITAVLFTATIASIDEFNQSFNAARTGTIEDVILDVSGGIFAAFVYWVISRGASGR